MFEWDSIMQFSFAQVFFQFRRFHQKTFEPFCLWKCNLYLQSSHVSVSDFPFCVEISFRAEQRYALSSPCDCAGSSFSPVIEAHRRTRVWWIPACAQAEVKAVRLVLIVAHVGRSLSLGWSKETPTCNPRLMKSFMSCCMAVMYTNALKQTRSTQTFQLRYIGEKNGLKRKSFQVSVRMFQFCLWRLKDWTKGDRAGRSDDSL